MRNTLIAFLAVAGCFAATSLGSIHRQPRVWVDITHQSPNIFTNADACPEDHPVKLRELDEKNISVGNRIIICGQVDSDGIHIKETDVDGKWIKSTHTMSEFSAKSSKEN